MSRKFLRARPAVQRPDWLADDAVSCEPVSAANSLLTAKLTGNFAKSGRPPRFSCLMSARIQWLPAEFPTQLNREFPNAYQGIFFEEQGILIEGAAKPGEPQTPGVAASKLVHSLTAQIGPLSGAKRTLLGERVMSAPDAVDGAHSAASKCYRLVASKPERFKEVRPGNDDGV